MGFYITQAGAGLAICLSMSILCFQVAAVKGSFLKGIDHIVYSFQKRTHADPHDFPPDLAAGLKSSTAEVVLKYVAGTFFDANNYLAGSRRFLPHYFFKIRYSHLLVLFFVFSVILYCQGRRHGPEQERNSSIAVASNNCCPDFPT